MSLLAREGDSPCARQAPPRRRFLSGGEGAQAAHLARRKAALFADLFLEVTTRLQLDDVVDETLLRFRHGCTPLVCIYQ